MGQLKVYCIAINKETERKRGDERNMTEIIKKELEGEPAMERWSTF